MTRLRLFEAFEFDDSTEGRATGNWVKAILGSGENYEIIAFTSDEVVFEATAASGMEGYTVILVPTTTFSPPPPGDTGPDEIFGTIASVELYDPSGNLVSVLDQLPSGIAFYEINSVDVWGYGVTVEGSDGDDVIWGSTRIDVIIGGGGDDELYGSNRFAYGELIIGGPGQDYIDAGAGNDDILAGGGDEIFAGDGSDYIELDPTLPGALFVDGGAGVDLVAWDFTTAPITVYLDQAAPVGASELHDVEIVFMSEGGGSIFGGVFNDTIIGGAGADRIEGGGGQDLIAGLDGDDILLGGDDDDLFDGGAGNDLIDGGAGSDAVDYSAAGQGVTVDLRIATAQNTGFGMDTLVSIETIYGTEFSDTLTASGAGGEYLFGEGGDDRLASGIGDDTLSGGLGVDTVSYANASGRVVIDLQIAGAQNTVSDGLDTLSGIENLEGSAFNDSFRGDDAANTMHGGGDTDLLDGRGGADILYGGEGIDRLYGRAGDDQLYGEASHDLIHANEGADLLDGGDGNDRLYGWEGDDTMYGGDGGDRLYGWDGADIGHGGLLGDFLNGHGGNDRLYGDEGDDGLYGADGNDILYGGVGNDILKGDDAAVGHDRLYGGDGADRLYGDGGDDVIDGGAGNDFIYGGAGIDTLTGGAGADLFIFLASVELGGPSLLATITDFNDAEDFIDLRSIDADPNTAGNQAFTWTPGGFTGQAGQAFLSYDAGTGLTTLALDIDGDGVADYEIQLQGEIDQSAHFLI